MPYLGQDCRATHGAHGKPFHKRYKFRGYAAQDHDPDELYDDGASEWQSEWADDGAYYEADDAEEAEEWPGPDAFDSSAVCNQHDGDDGTMDEAPWHDVGSYDQAYMRPTWMLANGFPICDWLVAFCQSLLSATPVPATSALVSLLQVPAQSQRARRASQKAVQKVVHQKGGRRPTSTALLP